MGAPTLTLDHPALRDRVEAGAMRDLFRAAPAHLVDALGIASHWHAGATMVRVEALRGAREFNRALGLGPTEEDLAGQMTAIRRFFGDRTHIAALDAGASGACRASLMRAGYTPGYAWDTFVRGSDAPSAADTDLSIRAAGADDAEEVGAVIRTGFGLPPSMDEWIAALVGRPGWTVVVAEDAGTLVGAAAVLIDGEAAWFGLGATLPAHRGRGAQNALFHERIAIARAAGCTLLTTETGAPGADGPGPSYRNMLRAGFTPTRRRENWQAPRG